MTIIVKNKHTLQIDDFRFNCCIGKKGSSNHKREGDNKTPKGTYEIENLYFRKDREFKPLTSLKCINIEDNMGWCNDIRFPTKYNKLIKIKKGIRHEKLKERIINIIFSYQLNIILKNQLRTRVAVYLST